LEPAVAAVGFCSRGSRAAEAGRWKIESWRNDDADIWNSKNHPRLQQTLPDIKIEFAPSAPKEYNAALNARLDAKPPATSSLAVRSTPRSRSYQKRQLDGLDDLKGMDNFSDVAKAAWRTDDGKMTFCVPIASVISWLHLQQGSLRQGSASLRAEDAPKNSTPCSRN